MGKSSPYMMVEVEVSAITFCKAETEVWPEGKQMKLFCYHPLLSSLIVVGRETYLEIIS